VAYSESIENAKSAVTENLMFYERCSDIVVWCFGDLKKVWKNCTLQIQT